MNKNDRISSARLLTSFLRRQCLPLLRLCRELVIHFVRGGDCNTLPGQDPTCQKATQHCREKKIKNQKYNSSHTNSLLIYDLAGRASLRRGFLGEMPIWTKLVRTVGSKKFIKSCKVVCT